MEALAYCEDLGDRLVVVNANSSKRNALTPEYYQVICDALELAGRESRITSVILRGEGDFFCAGGDLSVLAGRRLLSRAERLAKVEVLNNVIRAIIGCPKLVIAAIQGGAAGAGASIAFACDFIVAEKAAKFSIAYVKAGLVPDGGLTMALSTYLPRPLLMQLALLGESISVQRLFELGAISQVAEMGETLSLANELADKITLGPSATHGTIKTLIHSAYTNTLNEQLRAESDAMADALASAESAEGIKAFLEKRKTDFVSVRNKK